tara:strand:- start:35 stop:220 length:186 start_codon:yes stop_codon:yes gene_type:complete
MNLSKEDIEFIKHKIIKVEYDINIIKTIQVDMKNILGETKALLNKYHEVKEVPKIKGWLWD